MKRILFILLLTIPLIGFNQDLSNTVWDINFTSGQRYILVFDDDGTFGFVVVRGWLFKGEIIDSSVPGDETDLTWTVTGNKVILNTTDEDLSWTGEIYGKYMSGTCFIGGEKEKWSGVKLE